MNKKKAIEMHKLVVLSMLLQECLDELNPDTKRMKELRATLLQFTEELNDGLKDTFTMQKTTYFQDLSNKVDTILRKNFNPEM